MKKTLLFLLTILAPGLNAQPWQPDLGNGRYKNPIIFADYSDPDAIRVGDDFYMTASSFNCIPGLPVLHSKDLVNWTIVNHVYDSLPLDKYDKPVHGEGSWAPALRYHDGRYYVYFCTPRDGLFMAVASDPRGEWELNHIEKVEMWEDPCPLWDDDGSAYLVRSKVCGNELFLHKMSPDGRRLLDNGVSIFKSETQPTIEGPKFLKKDGYYYILAPAGGVPQGWQTVLRSRNIYGPYEEKIVLHKGNTEINGPHQGGLVETGSGEWWFIHFQDRDMYGRIVHLQPVSWKDGWPLMGVDIDGDGIGEPVMEYKKPGVGGSFPVRAPQTSDEFDGPSLGLQWQWHANPKAHWSSLSAAPGRLRLYAVKNHSQGGNLWFVPNLLLQKFPAPAFTVTAKIDFHGESLNEKGGLVVMGETWRFVALVKGENGLSIELGEGEFNQCEDKTIVVESVPLTSGECYLRLEVEEGGVCRFSYSVNGVDFNPIGREGKARKGRWIGAKAGLFCVNPNIRESSGYMDVDWFRVE